MARAVLLFVTAAAAACGATAQTGSASFPDPRADVPSTAGEATAVVAGGCFWGVEAVFERLRGVSDVVSGYAGGARDTARYDLVGTGRTGHAEAVRITYDPAQISFGQLLKVFFAVAHDPTQLNRQGPDVGPQYRSAIFHATPEQQAVADAYVRQLNEAQVFGRPIVTTIDPLDAFYPAEANHQDFVARYPAHPYVVYHDLPKVRRLERSFPDLLKPR
jgi:peptide-methionine (S)-S-oxide reductase